MTSEQLRPITMQDVRLAVGEGPLSAADVLAGCNAELQRRASITAPMRDGEVERLREAAIHGALCLSGYIGEGISIVACEDPEDAYGRIMAALGMPDADDDDLRAALIAPPSTNRPLR